MTDNPVQAEYIVMEEAPGISLADVWGDMGLQSKDKVIQDLVVIEKKLLSVSFTWLVSWQSPGNSTDLPRYGNIYFAEDSFPGCKKAEVSGDVSIELKKEVEERFTIGPVVEHTFWRREQASVPIDRGPCKRPRTYQPRSTSCANRL